MPDRGQDPDGLLSIGELARLSSLSVKQLRHYHEQGVLTPTAVSVLSRRRYYRRTQAATAELIALLRSIDMPLKDIRRLLRESPDRRKELLAKHRQTLSARVETAHRMLDELDAMLKEDEMAVEVKSASEFVNRLEESWQLLSKELTRLGEADFDRKLEHPAPKRSGYTAVLAPGPTVKEQLANLTFWVETIVPVIVDMRQQEPLPVGDWYGGTPFEGWGNNDWHFEREAAWVRTRTGAEVVARLTAAHRRALEYVRTLTDQEIGEEQTVFGDMPLRIEHKLSGCGYDYYDAVREQIERLKT